MASRNRKLHLREVCALAVLLAAGMAWTARFLPAQAPAATPPLETGFAQQVRPFLQANCVKCHNAENQTSGVRVDHLDAGLEDRHMKLWEAVRHRINDGTMPPKGLPQPSVEDRQRATAWIGQALETARLRPAPKNGLVRRLTKAQYRNTLRELLLLEDDLTEPIPPDAVSKDGFVNNKETLQLSPLLVEAYLEAAEEALQRVIVDPARKPKIQNFRMDLGESVNPQPFPDPLVLGANSYLLENKDFEVTQLTAKKPFPFEPFFMRTKYRFIEGYQGNDTVRGWREYDSIYHSVFACMRGSMGYPKGRAYSLVPEGLLLRPAIPNDELFDAEGTYGPKANFKISLRELPDDGRFRVTVTAAKYEDGLMLDVGAEAQAGKAGAIVLHGGVKPGQTATVAKAGIYQVDAYAAPRTPSAAAADATRLSEGLALSWPLDGTTANRPERAPLSGKLEGKPRFTDSPFGKALSFETDADGVSVSGSPDLEMGSGNFTISAWIHPKQLRSAGILAKGGNGWKTGWIFATAGNKGALRLETMGPNEKANGTVTSPPGMIAEGAWQHVAAVVKRGKGLTRLYVNGYPVAAGDIGAANLDNPAAELQAGRAGGGQPFSGELDEIRLYRRALSDAEIQGLLEGGRQFVKAPPEVPYDFRLLLGGRELSGSLQQPAFAAIRLQAGPLAIGGQFEGPNGLDRMVLTPLAEEDALAARFRKFEKRVPRVGVYIGLRRDCGSTLAPVGAPQPVPGTNLGRYVFEGAIRNFPSPEVEKDNVNYLAGVREIAVRSEYTDGRDVPRLRIRTVEFEGPFYESWPPPAHKAIFIDSPRKNEPKVYAREIVRSFATRAFRRPISAAEESSLMAVFEKSSSSGRNFTESIRDTLAVVLTSPQFLFLIEKSATPEPEPLDDYELASKLSYFLWNGPPDRAALRLASVGALRGKLAAEIDRMISDSRFARFTQEFASQWLALDKFQVLEPDKKLFPKLTGHTRNQLKQEPVQFLQYMIRNNLPARNLIESDFLVANESVASYYGLDEKSESGFQFVPILHGRRELGGVLTQAAVLAGLSDGRESNPVKRGAWLARRIIAEPPDDPPPNVPALPQDTSGLTLRQRIEKHRSQPGCAQCHSKIDPWGVAFEEFDAGGRLKAKAVDAHSKLPDQAEVSGAISLKRHLSEDRIDQVAFSLLKHLATYATGRTLTYNELNFLKQDGHKLRAGDYRMKDLIQYVASSKLFLEK